jgi:hypothetical protein
LSNSRHHWVEEEVKDWIAENWSTWQKEKPDWFDKAFKARIPLDFIPSAGGRDEEAERRAKAVITPESSRTTVGQVAPEKG